jgi:hypothetical protein
LGALSRPSFIINITLSSLLIKQSCTTHKPVFNHIFVKHQHHLLELLALRELFIENLAQLIVAPEEDLFDVSQAFLRRNIL